MNHEDHDLERLLRGSLADHARQAPAAAPLAERIISAAQSDVAPVVRLHPRPYRTLLLPFVAAASVAAIIGSTLAISSALRNSSAPPANTASATTAPTTPSTPATKKAQARASGGPVSPTWYRSFALPASPHPGLDCSKAIAGELQVDATAVGDLTGDGIPEVAAGASCPHSTSSWEGDVEVYQGTASGPRLLATVLTPQVGRWIKRLRIVGSTLSIGIVSDPKIGEPEGWWQFTWNGSGFDTGPDPFAIPTCDNLVVGMRFADEINDHSAVVLSFETHERCVITGYPGFDLIDSKGASHSAARTTSGRIGGTYPVDSFILEAGQVAYAMVESERTGGHDCYTSVKFQVTPPNTEATQTFDDALHNTCNLQVHPVVRNPSGKA